MDGTVNLLLDSSAEHVHGGIQRVAELIAGWQTRHQEWTLAQFMFAQQDQNNIMIHTSEALFSMLNLEQTLRLT